MKTYPIPLVPGPTSVSPYIRAAYAEDFGSSDLEDEFFTLYDTCSHQLGDALGARESDVVIMSGEGMLALWSALKSVLRPNDKVIDSR